MGSVIEIHLATVDEKAVGGIARDIVEFLKQYDYHVSYAEIHKKFVLK